MNSLEMIFKDESVKLVAFVDEIQISRTQAIISGQSTGDGEPNNSKGKNKIICIFRRGKNWNVTN
ncbi:hypothetical protein SAMN04489735_106311 [Aneurinibacillus thermoaerophilus]|uniref:Uncharacterized protein n=1 Tax=Aneurinibacillus thermoaerophilus TaxID=143495 RepID=A0A1G8FDW6_ANETH|nr:hypothetical protein ACH33_16795 [Aneurinibacillus sp. XH2]SDH80189.1 hypothetical protein SAMN04489735_106311 [Aneurinibacillus thermoaerophilus]